MKTINTILLASSVVLFSACSSEKNENLVVVKPAASEKIPVAVNAEMEVSVEGMTCEMGCGGSLRKALKDTKAVDQVSFLDFDADADKNKAIIRFDRTKISADKLVSLMEEINEKQFTISDVKTKTVDSDATSSNTGSIKKADDAPVKMTSPTLEIPNLIDLFTSFLK